MMIPGDKISLPKEREAGWGGGRRRRRNCVELCASSADRSYRGEEKGGAAMFRRKPGNSASKQAVMRVTK